jgi:hypothetical protein
MKALANYKNHKETKSCYLDGRYINIVLKEIEEFAPQVIKVKVIYDKDGELRLAAIKSKFIHILDGMNIIRVVINSNFMSHSALLWLDTDKKTAIFSDVIAEEEDDDKETRKVVEKLIEKYVKDFFPFKFQINKIVVPYVDQPGCFKYGFCNAYVLKQVYDYAVRQQFDSSNIKNFAGAIEDIYGSQLDPYGEPEIEYRSGRGYRGRSVGRRFSGGPIRRTGRGYYPGFGGMGLGFGLGLLGGAALGSNYYSGAYGYDSPEYVENNYYYY